MNLQFVIAIKCHTLKRRGGGSSIFRKGTTVLFYPLRFSNKKNEFLRKVRLLYVFYDSKILNPKLAPNWFTNVKVTEITPNPGVSGTGPLDKNSGITWTVAFIGK